MYWHDKANDKKESPANELKSDKTKKSKNESFCDYQH